MCWAQGWIISSCPMLLIADKSDKGDAGWASFRLWMHGMKTQPKPEQVAHSVISRPSGTGTGTVMAFLAASTSAAQLLPNALLSGWADICGHHCSETVNSTARYLDEQCSVRQRKHDPPALHCSSVQSYCFSSQRMHHHKPTAHVGDRDRPCWSFTAREPTRRPARGMVEVGLL